MTITIRDDIKPLAAQAIELFLSVGWGEIADYDAEKWQVILEGTHTAVTAYDGDRLVGMARFSCDEGHETHLYEIAIHPEYQRRGIGRKIMLRANEIFADTSIYIGGPQKNEAFFLACGYTPREQLKVFTRKVSK